MRNKTINCLFLTVEIPQISDPNPETSGRGTLYYLRWLPNTSIEIGREN
jgi:hypothetical protein